MSYGNSNIKSLEKRQRMSEGDREVVIEVREKPRESGVKNACQVRKVR